MNTVVLAELLSAAALVAGAGVAPAAAGAGAEAERGTWRPDVAAARAYARRRAGTVSFAVRTPRRSYGFRSERTERSASVVEAMLLVAYLRQGSVRDRPLRADERALLGPMIRSSDNDAAIRAWTEVGDAGLRRVARAARMRAFVPGGPTWGGSRITARDQALLFLRIDRRLPARHRAYAMGLLRTIVPAQRWASPARARAGGRCTSRAAGAREPARSITRSRSCGAAGNASRW